MRLRRSVVALLAFGVISSACASRGHHDLELAVRAVALDLSFSKEELKQPVEPEHILRIIPAPPQVVSGEIPFDELTSPTPPVIEPPDLPFDCPPAPPGAQPDKPAPVFVGKRVEPGRYLRHNKGSFTVTSGILNLQLPFPFFTFDTLSKPKEIIDDTVAGQVNRGIDPTYKTYEWSVRHDITNTISTTTTYRLTPAAIQIVKITNRNGDTVDTVVPNPPVDLLELNKSVGDTWRTAGVDTEHRTAIAIDALLEKTEPVDMCGKLVDTLRVTTTETIVNLATGQTSGTQEGKKNVYNFATGFGGLIASYENHTRLAAVDADSGSAITVVFDYKSTLDDVHPTKVSF